MSSRYPKSVLADSLLDAIAEHNYIPFMGPVDDRQFRIVDNSDSDGHIRIRLLLGK